jgi:hypothetical protein
MNTVSVLTPETSFAVAIMNDETLFERLVAYNRGFHKFSRVVMREDVASQLALGDLASMAGVPSADVLAVAGGGAPETAAASPGEPAFRDSRGKMPKPLSMICDGDRIFCPWCSKLAGASA